MIAIPVAYAVGQRIVLLASTIVLVIGTVISARATSYEMHLGARCIIGMAAGQSEALVPMITKVCYSPEASPAVRFVMCLFACVRACPARGCMCIRVFCLPLVCPGWSRPCLLCG